jgi:hypothetical protein
MRIKHMMMVMMMMTTIVMCIMIMMMCIMMMMMSKIDCAYLIISFIIVIRLTGFVFEIVRILERAMYCIPYDLNDAIRRSGKQIR